MEILIDYIAQCLSLCDRVVQYFRIQNHHAGLRHMELLSKKLIDMTSKLIESKTILENSGYIVQPEEIAAILTGVMDAEKEQDYILLSDLLELQLKPYLLQIQGVLVTCVDTSDLRKDLWKNNLQGLQGRYSKLEKQLNQEMEEYLVEPTSSGYPTLCMTDDSGTYYFHSNVNPVTESGYFAKQYYSMEQDHYVIFGLGLGYHVKEFCQIDDGIDIVIIEPDLQMIKTACATIDLSWLYENERIHLVYDPQYTEITQYLSEDVSFIIHYPSLRHVAQEKVRLQLEKYFISDSGKRNFKIQFCNNFRDNIINCNGYVDELKDIFYGKNVVIVAAGPSLDKNIGLLKNRPENTVILAVGTVFRKMVSLGIYPDYVIFLDAQPHLYCQIEGLEHMEIPIICASSACKKIAKQYQGKKYLICQKGYDRAEQYAGQHGYTTYETGGSVSTIALDMCLQLGCKSVAYIGLDLAFTDGHTHADSAFDNMASEEEKNVLVPATGGGTVYASRLFVMYKEWIERRVAKEQGKITIYDATEGGALKKGLKCISLQALFQQWESESSE